MPGTGDDYFPATTFARYGLLVGTITGWLLWYFCFLLRIRSPVSCTGSGSRSAVGCFVAGDYSDGGDYRSGKYQNTYGAIRGTDVFYPQQGAGKRVIVAALWRPDL